MCNSVFKSVRLIVSTSPSPVVISRAQIIAATLKEAVVISCKKLTNIHNEFFNQMVL